MNQGKSSSQSPISPAGEVRIIAGKWRRRKLSFSASNIRPTPDRVRETLFNWLIPDIAGASCLDLFAGSGVLGIEALSRGANQVIAVEQDPVAWQTIQNHKKVLSADSLTTHCMDVLEFLKSTPNIAFDIVFLDPPYAENYWACCIELLQQGWVDKGSLVFIEYPEKTFTLPSRWETIRSQNAGKVYYDLVRVN